MSYYSDGSSVPEARRLNSEWVHMHWGAEGVIDGSKNPANRVFSHLYEQYVNSRLGGRAMDTVIEV